MENKKISPYKKILLVILIIIFVSSTSIFLKFNKLQNQNPFIDYINSNCNNNDSILINNSLVKNHKYSIYKNNFVNGKYNCIIFDNNLTKIQTKNINLTNLYY